LFFDIGSGFFTVAPVVVFVDWFRNVNGGLPPRKRVRATLDKAGSTLGHNYSVMRNTRFSSSKRSAQGGTLDPFKNKIANAVQHLPSAIFFHTG